MEYVITYIIIGLVYSMVITRVDQMEVEGHPSNEMHNLDRIVSILLWPILSVIVLYAIIESFNDKLNNKNI